MRREDLANCLYRFESTHNCPTTMIFLFSYELQLVQARGCAYVVMVHRADAARALNALKDLKLNGTTCKVTDYTHVHVQYTMLSQQVIMLSQQNRPLSTMGACCGTVEVLLSHL